MPEKFEGNIKTLWDNNHRDMTLLEEVSYTDPNNKKWTVPAGSFLNGATIPSPLWSTIGSPYTGKYRRASVIHDFFVGEGRNPNVNEQERKSADKMFYHACLFDGCSKKEASVLYIRVRIGTWVATRTIFKHEKIFESSMDKRMNSPAELKIRDKFSKVYLQLQNNLDNFNIDELEQHVDNLLER